MSEDHRKRPAVSGARLCRELAGIGVERGITLIVHSSLRAIGWVDGGPATVVRALVETLGDTGTLAMPAATPQCLVTEPAVPSAPEFDVATTPTTLGAIPETFRTWPGTLRSDHPTESVSARGPLAREITGEHALAFSEGPGTPFGKLHELDAAILLIGVGFNRCTALHHAETLCERRRLMQVRFVTRRSGRPALVEVPNVADDNDTHFPVIGERFVSAGKTRTGKIGAAPSMLCSMRELVTFAKHYFDTVL